MFPFGNNPPYPVWLLKLHLKQTSNTPAKVWRKCAFEHHSGKQAAVLGGGGRSLTSTQETGCRPYHSAPSTTSEGEISWFGTCVRPNVAFTHGRLWVFPGATHNPRKGCVSLFWLKRTPRITTQGILLQRRPGRAPRGHLSACHEEPVLCGDGWWFPAQTQHKAKMLLNHASLSQSPVTLPS